MMTAHEVESMMLIHRERLKEFERRQRRGEFWLSDEAARSLKMTRTDRQGLTERLLQSTGDLLISSGLKLRGRARSESTPAVIQAR